MKKVLLIALAALVLALPAAADKPRPLVFHSGWASAQHTGIIEKQSWFLDCCTPDPNHTIVNSFAGTWDINEHASSEARGYLDPGAAASASWQHAWDWNPMYSCRPICANWSGLANATGFYLIAPSPNLDATICFQGRCFNPGSTYDTQTRTYRYRFCGQAVYEPDDPALVDIPGSQAADGTWGRGAPSTITLTVTNPTGRVVKNILAYWSVSSDIIQEAGCSESGLGTSFLRVPLPNSDYPFAWS